MGEPRHKEKCWKPFKVLINPISHSSGLNPWAPFCGDQFSLHNHSATRQYGDGKLFFVWQIFWSPQWDMKSNFPKTNTEKTGAAPILSLQQNVYPHWQHVPVGSIIVFSNFVHLIFITTALQLACAGLMRCVLCATILKCHDIFACH